MTKTATLTDWQLESSYADQLPGLYEFCDPEPFPDPRLLQFNEDLAASLGLTGVSQQSDGLAKLFSGAALPAGARSLAQAYAGHQFGGFVPQLGDGRAILLGEAINTEGHRHDIALKGSGRTPFSRGGDGRAAVGPVLREYLLGEAMHALGVPTTRALAAVSTGEPVMREMPLPGAILTRVAASHIRVGTYQYFAARGQHDDLRKLADYTIDRHDPDLAGKEDRYLLLLQAAIDRQAKLIAKWMLLGFIHGVMNTDNTAISGETIDYGPCAWMEAFDPQAVFSSIDRGGRYAYENQPVIANWNLARFAETLLPLISPEDPAQAIGEATEIIENFVPRYEAAWLAAARAKLGLVMTEEEDSANAANREVDQTLAKDWLDLLAKHKVDFTLGWRRLAEAAEGNPGQLTALFPAAKAIASWLERWRDRLADQPAEVTAGTIRSVSPIYVPRNHLVEAALEAASSHSNLEPFEQLLEVISNPYEERPGFEKYAEPASRKFTACYQTFCGT